MFRARRAPNLLSRLFRVVWPRKGWSRGVAYLGHRVGRLPGTPSKIAAGFACGAAISFTPFIGFHFVLAAFSSWLLGGNLLASAIGTVVGNPWTFPIIWISSYRLGCWFLGQNSVTELPQELTMTYIVDNPGAVLLPMAMGGIPMAVVAWVVSYWLVRRAVDRYQKMRIARRRRRFLRRRRPGNLGTETLEL